MAAILSADAVGYSRLMARDEVETLRTLNLHRDATGGLIRQVWLRKAIELDPDSPSAFSPAHLGAFLPPAVVEHYVEGLRKAGWKD